MTALSQRTIDKGQTRAEAPCCVCPGPASCSVRPGVGSSNCVPPPRPVAGLDAVPWLEEDRALRAEMRRSRQADGLALEAEMGRSRHTDGRRLTSKIERTAPSFVRSCQPFSPTLRWKSIANCGAVAHFAVRSAHHALTDEGRHMELNQVVCHMCRLRSRLMAEQHGRASGGRGAQRPAAKPDFLNSISTEGRRDEFLLRGA